MSKITYEDKVTIHENGSIPDINKVKANDMNEIKNVVNENMDILDALANKFFPVGKIEMFYDSADHSSYLGFTWVRVGAGRFPVGWNGASSTETQFKKIGQTGGERNHTLTVEEMPEHNHGWYVEGGSNPNYGGKLQAGSTRLDLYATSNAGGGQAHNNLPPYIVYAFWRRAA